MENLELFHTRKLALSEKITMSELEELSKSDDMITRYFVARNPKSTMEILNILALDEDVEVRDMALKHRTIKVRPKESSDKLEIKES